MRISSLALVFSGGGLAYGTAWTAFFSWMKHGRVLHADVFSFFLSLRGWRIHVTLHRAMLLLSTATHVRIELPSWLDGD